MLRVALDQLECLLKIPYYLSPGGSRSTRTSLRSEATRALSGWCERVYEVATAAAPELLAFEAELAGIPRPLIAALWEAIDEATNPGSVDRAMLR